MDELDIKRNEKKLEKNKIQLLYMLEFIQNKNLDESFVVKDLKSINKFNKLLNQMYVGRILRLSNLKGHETIFEVRNRKKLVMTLHNFLYDLFGGSYIVKVEKVIFPPCLSFSRENSDEVYYLFNWDSATIVV